jgi:hypothetical protein
MSKDTLPALSSSGHGFAWTMSGLKVMQETLLELGLVFRTSIPSETACATEICTKVAQHLSEHSITTPSDTSPHNPLLTGDARTDASLNFAVMQVQQRGSNDSMRTRLVYRDPLPATEWTSATFIKSAVAPIKKIPNTLPDRTAAAVGSAKPIILVLGLALSSPLPSSTE